MILTLIKGKSMRTPSIVEALKVFNESYQSQIVSVIDVGVLSGTSFLMSEYKGAKHYLFEPVVPHHRLIREGYHRHHIEYELIGAAVSDESGVMYQHLLSSDLSGSITHSQLLPSKSPEKFGKQLLDVIETPVVTLDEWFGGVGLAQPYLVKIDVDGIEEKIIDGGRSTLSNASLVIVEAPLVNLVERASKLQALGLRLFDIVGNGYYFDQLQQVDLVFINQSIVAENINFRPWEKTGKVMWEKWWQYDS